MQRFKTLAALVAVLALAVTVAACGGDDNEGGGGSGGGEGGQNLSGTIRADGSSTVAPLTEAAAELFREENSGVRISVGTSGTGGGFEKFCRGETDISDASRQIKEDEEAPVCEKAGIRYEEITVANDALALVIHPDNDWASCLTTDQLKQIWDKDSKVKTWKDVDPSWPDEEIKLYGPGTDSGTFDYFTEAINGEEGVQRTDYNNIGEDDNATITGVSGDKNAMGYLGYSFVQENEGTVKAAEVDGGDGCVAPTVETAQDGSYKPLARELYVYLSDKAIQRPEVQAFANFYIENATPIAEQAQYIPLTDEQKTEAQEKVANLGGSK